MSLPSIFRNPVGRHVYIGSITLINELKPDIIHAQASKAALLVARLRQGYH